MANEIYHRSNWGESKPEGFGDMYFDSNATNKLFNRSTYYENSDATDKILANIPNKASIVFTATGYSQDKIGSAIPVDANGDFDFHRESTATRVNEAGLIEASQGNDTPRIDFTTGEGAFLIEPESTNLITYSEDFSDSSWTKLGAGTGSVAVVTSNYAVSPDGTQNASRLQCDLNGGTSSSANQSLISDTYSSSSDQTISIYVKSNNGQNQTIYFANTQTSGDTIVVTSEWQRFTFTHSTSTYVLAIGLRGRSGGGIDDTADVLIWGSQAEAESFATSYIPTNGSTATRVAERANSSGNSDLFNDSEGVLYAEIASLAEAVGSNKKFSISSGATSNSVVFSYRSTNNQIQVLVKSGGTTTVNITTIISPAVTNFFKIAIKYKTDDCALFVNGTKVATDTSAAMPTGLNTLDFDRGDGGQDHIGKVKCIAVFKEALTDAELTQLTS